MNPTHSNYHFNLSLPRLSSTKTRNFFWVPSVIGVIPTPLVELEPPWASVFPYGKKEDK